MSWNPPQSCTATISRLHMPSGRETLFRREFTSRTDLLEHLERWNAQQPRTWKYWEHRPAWVGARP